MGDCIVRTSHVHATWKMLLSGFGGAIVDYSRGALEAGRRSMLCDRLKDIFNQEH